jgi:hypothetical protein
MRGVRGGAAEDLSLWTGPAATVVESIRRAGRKDREAWPAALGGAVGGVAKDHGIYVSAAFSERGGGARLWTDDGGGGDGGVATALTTGEVTDRSHVQNAW